MSPGPGKVKAKRELGWRFVSPSFSAAVSNFLRRRQGQNGSPWGRAVRKSVKIKSIRRNEPRRSQFFGRMETTAIGAQTTSAPVADRSGRLGSLDALRGFDMFWIVGGGGIIHTLALATKWRLFSVLSLQLEHVKWEGFHFYDLIFPLFMFMVGTAIPYSLFSRIERGEPKSSIYRKVFKRFVLLFVFGLVYNQGWKTDWGTTSRRKRPGGDRVRIFVCFSDYLAYSEAPYTYYLDRCYSAGSCTDSIPSAGPRLRRGSIYDARVRKRLSIAPSFPATCSTT